MPDFWDIVLPITAIAGGSVLANLGASQAADEREAAADRSADVQERIYRQSREDFGPFRDVGTNALYNLASLYGVEYADAPGTLEDRYATGLSRFQASPSYEFRLGEGLRALDRAAAARGLLQSGPQLRAITRYGQDLAGEEYNNYLNRLAALAGLGQSATGAGAQVAQAAARGIGLAYENAGAARASSYASTANALGRGIQNALYAWGMW